MCYGIPFLAFLHKNICFQKLWQLECVCCWTLLNQWLRILCDIIYPTFSVVLYCQTPLLFIFKKLSHICKLLLKNILFKYICTLQELSKSHIIKKKNVSDSEFSIRESDHVFWTFLLYTLCLLTFFIFSFSLFCFLFFTRDQFISSWIIYSYF